MTSVIQKPKTATAQNADDADEFLKELRRLQREKGAKPVEPKPPGGNGFWQTAERLAGKANDTQESDRDVTQESQELQRYKESQELHRNTSRQAAPDGAGDFGFANEDESASAEPEPTICEYWEKYVSLPFIDYLKRLIKEFWKHESATEFEHAGAWKSQLFNFVRLLKAHPDMQEQTAKKAFREIDGIFRRSLGGQYAFLPESKNDPWMRWLCLDATEAQIEFLYCWPKIRFLPGQTPLKQAYDRAKEHRLHLDAKTREKWPCDDNGSSTKDFEFFISLAGWLQIVMGDKPILLPCREVGELMGISAISVSRYRHMAVEDKFLTLTKGHSFRSKGKGKSEATEFRFDVSRCEMLKSKSQNGTVESFKARA